MQPAPDTVPTEHRWLRRFCYAVALTTFVLIVIGGKVTSYEFGMAIITGWTTGGWLSFLAPLDYWFNDTDKFWEHTHRIVGSLVGLLAVAMTVWLWTTQRSRPWLRWLGVIMLLMVCFQGYLGATRVDYNSLTRAFIHGIGGQLILCGWVVIAAALSRPWLNRLQATAQRQRKHPNATLRWAVRILLLLLLIQLTLGSAVRHFKADKAIPDFPLVYGQWFPPLSQDALDQAYVAYYTPLTTAASNAPDHQQIVVNRTPRGEIVVTMEDVYLQYTHRLGAVVVCLLGLFVIIGAVRRSGERSIVLAPAFIVLALFAAQFALGVMTVLSETEPIMATLHQATGAVLIAAATWLAVRIHLAEYAAQPPLPASPRSKPAPTGATPSPMATV